MDTTKTKLFNLKNVADERSTAWLWLLKQDRFTLEQAELVKSLSHEFEIFLMQLGDDITIDPGSTDNTAQQNLQHFFFVCQGQLRILGFDADKQREVSTNLLTEGETFGGESFGDRDWLPYRVVATDDACIAKISLDKLQPFLSKLPALARKWQAETEQHQKLLFLKR